MRVVGVIQARTGSTRLPGKVLEPIEGRPLVAWTIDAVSAVRGLDDLVVATSDDPSDDGLAAAVAALGVRVHRGPVFDVLRRVADAVRPLEPDVVLRQTGDNPFPDPAVMAAQIARLLDGAFDYVGIAGLPLGIGGEAVRMPALEAADREAEAASEREHVLPFVYTRPERFRIGVLETLPPWRHGRYTVDTVRDLEFARRLAAQLPAAARPPRLADLEAVVAADPSLDELNRAVEQRDHRTAQLEQRTSQEEQ